MHTRGASHVCPSSPTHRPMMANVKEREGEANQTSRTRYKPMVEHVSVTRLMMLIWISMPSSSQRVRAEKYMRMSVEAMSKLRCSAHASIVWTHKSAFLCRCLLILVCKPPCYQELLLWRCFFPQMSSKRTALLIFLSCLCVKDVALSGAWRKKYSTCLVRILAVRGPGPLHLSSMASGRYASIGR